MNLQITHSKELGCVLCVCVFFSESLVTSQKQMKIVRIPHENPFHLVLVFCRTSVRTACISWRALRLTWTSPPRLPLILTYIFWPSDTDSGAKSYLTLNLFKLSLASVELHNINKLNLLGSIDLGCVPIKQSPAVEQQSSGPPGARPNAPWLQFTLL